MAFNSPFSKLMFTASVAALPARRPPDSVIDVSLYTDRGSPQQWFFAFRNSTGASLRFPEGRLPWNDGSAWDLEAQLVTNGKSVLLPTFPPIERSGFDVEVPAGEVRSAGVYFRDVIRDFDQLACQGDIVMRLSVHSVKRHDLPRFVTSPTIILIPCPGPAASRCPGVVSFLSCV